MKPNRVRNAPDRRGINASGSQRRTPWMVLRSTFKLGCHWLCQCLLSAKLFGIAHWQSQWRTVPESNRNKTLAPVTGLVAIASVCLTLGIGCSGPAIRPQSPDTDEIFEPEVTLISSMTRPFGLNFTPVEQVGLVTGLPGTGSDPAPSAHRAAMLTEMQRHKVDDPGDVLASSDTALVLIRGLLRPGIQKGDTFDIEVQVPSGSQTESLKGGWLLKSRLTEMAMLGNQVRSGHLLAVCEGPVLVDPVAESEDNRVHLTRGRVLSGGVAVKSRNLGLMLHGEHRSIRASQQIGIAINRRFNVFEHGDKQGVATPKTEEFIELRVHPRYKENIGRYMQVIRNIAFRETPQQRQSRLALLERQLMDPVTTASAAIRLEAIGKDGIEALKRGIGSKDPEVRFYAAEALAYLDNTDAALPLGEAAANEPAFRAFALAALSAMDDIVARDELRKLLSVSSAETRYGAFRALWTMNPNDPFIQGEELGGQFSYHVLETGGPPLLHVTRSKRPEIVLFGRNQTLVTPIALEAGKYILINAKTPEQVTVSRFEPGKPDQQRLVSAQLDDVIRAVVELGGTYPDVVQALHEARERSALSSRMKVDALPELGRSYNRRSRASDAEETSEEAE